MCLWIKGSHLLQERAALRWAWGWQNPRMFAMMAEGNVITESLGLDRDARQAEIWAKSTADIFLFASPSIGLHQQIASPISLSPRHISRQHASMHSQWVHARGQPHWVRCLGLSRGQGGRRGGLWSLSLILLCLSLAVCSVPFHFKCEHKFAPKEIRNQGKNQPCRY